MSDSDDPRYATYREMIAWTVTCSSAAASLLGFVFLLHVRSTHDGVVSDQRFADAISDLRADDQRQYSEMRELMFKLLSQRSSPASQEIRTGEQRVQVGLLDPLDKKPWLTLAEYAYVMGVSERTVRRWMESGKLAGDDCRRSTLSGRWEIRNPGVGQASDTVRQMTDNSEDPNANGD